MSGFVISPSATCTGWGIVMPRVCLSVCLSVNSLWSVQRELARTAALISSTSSSSSSSLFFFSFFFFFFFVLFFFFFFFLFWYDLRGWLGVNYYFLLFFYQFFYFYFLNGGITVSDRQFSLSVNFKSGLWQRSQSNDKTDWDPVFMLGPA